MTQRPASGRTADASPAKHYKSVLKVNLINIPKNDQIKLLLDKMKAVRTG